jgi:two-component system sensor histidine kinase SenX3
VRFRSATRPHDDPPLRDEGQVDADERELGLLRQAIFRLPIGVVVEDEDGHVVLRNATASEPFGDVQADALATEALRRVQAEARHGRACTESMELRGPVPRALELSAWPLEGGGTMAIVVDDSERRRLDAVRRDFVANVNHELRTPIGALGVLAEALADETDPHVVHRLAARIRGEVQRAHLVIEELLDFSRIEAEALAGAEPVDLHDVTAVAADRVAAHAEQRHVRVTVRTIDTRSALVLGSRPQLLSAVTNLLDNAVKYSDAGAGVDVEVVVADGRVEVVVRDAGIGIPAKDLDRIFERFYRVDSARDRRTGGTGLGLAIVRHVAANHGGSVEVASTEGTGSTFTMRLPAAPAAPTGTGAK